jgi:DNA-binding MarR family transcriptional regulator
MTAHPVQHRSALEDAELLERLSRIEQLLLRVSWLEQRRFAQDIAALNLTPPQFFVLRSILSRGSHPTPHTPRDGVPIPHTPRDGVPTPHKTRDGVPTMSALAYDTLQHCATVTGIVNRLEKMGLVARQRDAEDRRQVLVELTPRGRDLLSQIRGSREKRLRETLQRLSEQDASELLRLLNAYLQAFRLRYEDTKDNLPTDMGGLGG